MIKFRLKKDLFWLIIGYVYLSLSAILYIYDIYHTDHRLLRKVEANVQKELDHCINALMEKDTAAILAGRCLTCNLQYDFYGNLESWTQNQYLPTKRFIDQKSKLPKNFVVALDGGIYYQLQSRIKGNWYVNLFPLYIKSELLNDFLTPYVFLGKYYDRLSTAQIRELEVVNANVQPVRDDPSIITLKDPNGKPLYAILNFNPDVLRRNVRVGVFGFLLLGIISLLLSSRQFFLDILKRDFGSNLVFVGIILMMRFILWQVKLPGNYLDIELFSPKILAFHTLAPSLGELTINIFTLSLIVAIIYRSFYRTLNNYYRRVQRNHLLSWALSFVTIFTSVYLLSLYYDLFKIIIVNSQVELEFSNIFTTNIYSYLILLDVGLLLAAFVMVLLLLLKFNVLWGIRLNYSIGFWLTHIGMISLCSAYLFYPQLTQDYLFIYHFIIINLSVCLLMIILYRMPIKHIFNYDLTNYVFTVTVIAMLVTSNLTNSIELYNQLDVERVGKQILQEKLELTVKFNRVLLLLNSGKEEIANEMITAEGRDQFVQWLEEMYISANFKGFDTELSVYDEGERPREIVKEILDQTDAGTRLFLTEMKSEEGENVFIGEFSLQLDSLKSYDLVLRINPSEIKTEGLYPSLSMDRELYDRIKQVQRFDYALYRGGKLYDQNGKSSFPTSLEKYLPRYQALTNSYSRSNKSFIEFIAPGDNDQLSIIRYKKQTFLDVLTRFSIIFYFYTITSFVFFLTPIFFIRWQKGEQSISQLPLRAKIRVMVLLIILLPLFIVVINLRSFVQDRYVAQTEAALQESTSRITALIEQECGDMLKSLPDSRSQLLLKFKEIANVVEDDITLYDRDGQYITSTQPQIFETGISSDLMNAEAFSELRSGESANKVNREYIGNLPFFAAYKPILNEDNIPIAYVNIPYLGRQDQLNQQVLDFLSYFVNTYLLIFLIVNVVAIMLTNTITQPLQLIQDRLSSIQLGDYNRPIDYRSNDEIGDIIQAYNLMLDKLSQSEEKLKQSQREKAWRQMARQVAHEIKNPLTPMKLSIQHMNRAWSEQSLHLNKMFPRFVKTLLSQIDTLARIANSFSEFAKMPEPIKDQISINEVLLEVVDLYAQSDDIEWNIDIPNEEFWSYADRDQISRCFQNVVKNGVQAMEGKGTMDIRIYESSLDSCTIEIGDNGKGMSEEVQEMIFEPNFSTKSSGMGLGLAMVKRMIEISGGKIYFQSEYNKGTTFFIELPLVKKSDVYNNV